MIEALGRLAVSACKIREYHMDLVGEVPEDAHDLVALANAAGTLEPILVEALNKLRGKAALEAVVSGVGDPDSVKNSTR